LNRKIREKSPLAGCSSRVFDPTSPRISISRFYPLDLDANRGSEMGLDSRKLETEPSRQDRATLRCPHNVLIGVSGQAGVFRADSPGNSRMQRAAGDLPAIEPNLARESDRCVADIEAWTEGRTLIGVGSPFPPIMRDSSHFKVDQTNNSYIFPVSASVTITVWLCPARPRP
jgi:malic enzyme